jgi:hypothetical protein
MAGLDRAIHAFTRRAEWLPSLEIAACDQISLANNLQLQLW